MTGRISFIMYSTNTNGAPHIKIRIWAQTIKVVTHFWSQKSQGQLDLHWLQDL